MKLGKAYIKNQDFKNLYDLNERFLRGNSFNDLYSFYKLVPKTKNIDNLTNQERILLLIQEYNFALIDLALFLDTHPNCKNAIDEYLFINKELTKLKQFYKNNYEMLELDLPSNLTNEFTWALKSFPWEDNYNVEV